MVRGQCIIDEMYGAGPEGYFCKPNSFWKAAGPVVGVGNIRAWVPAVTPGAATLNGTTGFRPDLWEGTNTAGTQLEWHWSLIVYNTANYNGGGVWAAAPLGFDWNNQQWRATDTSQQFDSSDSGMVMYQ
jgi:hypothetical protein